LGLAAQLDPITFGFLDCLIGSGLTILGLTLLPDPIALDLVLPPDSTFNIIFIFFFIYFKKLLLTYCED